MHEVPTTRLTAPAQDLDSLSFCEGDPSGLAEWVVALPLANTTETAAQVRQATWEVARLRVPPPIRMDLLEQIRPILHYLCTRLDRNAATSSSHGNSIARLAQRLQTNLCSGYRAVVVAGLPAHGAEADSAEELVPLAIHRALSDLSRTLLRTLQFYVEPAERLWFQLNQLYLLAERLGVHEQQLEDAENHATPWTSTMSAYLRSLLLASCKPNQLRHRQLAEVFNYLELWAPYVTLERDSTAALFAVDLESEQGPLYTRLLTDAAEPRGIRTDALVQQLESWVDGQAATIKVPEGTGAAQLRHLAQAWGTMQPRSHRRTSASGTVKVCAGLRAAHYFLSGGVDFVDLLDDPDALVEQELNPFLMEQERAERHRPPAVSDVWDQAFDVRRSIPLNHDIPDPESILRGNPGSRRARQSEDAAAGYGVYDTSAVDTSPGGYQIRWHDPLPPQLQTGEIVALRETADQRWCVAVVRWIRQKRDGTLMGVELLAPRAIPVAARAIQKLGGPTPYTRALMLPELEPIDQPATLIMPRLPFQSGQKVHLQQQGVRCTVQLTTCVLRTESVNQFTYRLLSGYLESVANGPKMGDQ